jgi:hypothetical protein
MSAFVYRGDRARELFDGFVEIVRIMTQNGELNLMDVGGLDYSRCRSDQPDNILRVAYSVQFPGEEEEREGIMFLEHKSTRLQQPEFQIFHVFINHEADDLYFPINNAFVQRNPTRCLKKWIDIAMTTPFHTRQIRFDAYLRSNEQAIHELRMRTLLQNPNFSMLSKDLLERIYNESRRP